MATWMNLPGMFPEYNITSLHLSQTLVTSLISTLVFVLFVLVYNYLKKKNEDNAIVVMIDWMVEEMDKFFGSVSDKVPNAVKVYVLFLFFYILWNNLFGLFVDLFASVIPVLHHTLRPVSTDIIFNAMLAVFGVLWALAYGFKTHWFKFLERYFPLHWVGVSGDKPEIKGIKWFMKFILWLIVKILDILLGLFIGFLEFIGEFTKMLSLTLRLYGNIFAWAVLIILVVWFSMRLMKVPFLIPLVVVTMELLVSILQAFVFALLVMVYFKIAEESH